MPAEICLAVYCLDEKCIYSSCIHNTVLSASLSSDNELRYVMRHTPFCVHQDGTRSSFRNFIRRCEDSERFTKKIILRGYLKCYWLLLFLDPVTNTGR